MIESIFSKLHTLFANNGFKIYASGGTVRDFLLNKSINDFDFVTNAKPEDMKKFIKNGNFTFSKFGVVKYQLDGTNIDIVTMREESTYLDARHPNCVKFIDDLYEDSKRRDFTINALYMDVNNNIFDYWNGKKDLENRILRCIGDPIKRLREDPLRILRALRFSSCLNLNIEDTLDAAIKELLPSLNMLNPHKIEEEIKKFNDISILKKYNVYDYLMNY